MAACDVLETFEGGEGGWVVDIDVSGASSDVGRSSDEAYVGTYSAKCYTTTSGGKAQVRQANTDALPSYRWTNCWVYVPAATLAALSGEEYFTLASWYPSAGGNFGWEVRVKAGGELYVYGYEDGTGTGGEFQAYGTIPSAEWFEFEMCLYSSAAGGIQRTFCFLINGDIYGWYRSGNHNAEDFDRSAVGIVDSNTADDLTVYIDQWRDFGTTSSPCGSDNRPVGEYQFLDYRDQDGRGVQYDWSSWVNSPELDATHGMHGNSHIQSGFNQDLAPSYADGWAMIELSWPNGTPSDTTPSGFCSGMVAFHKDVEDEENLEIVPWGLGGGDCELWYEAWPQDQGTKFASWQLPLASIGGGSRIPEDGDRIFVWWKEINATDLRVVVDYYDASAATWYERVIDTIDDVSDEGGVDFMDDDHEAITLTTDSRM